MMLQFDASFMYASNLFCLKLIWFCLHRKGALGDDFLLEICWTVQFPNLCTGGNWKVLEEWNFWCISKSYLRLFFLTKASISNSFEGHPLTIIWQFKWTCKTSTSSFCFCWLDGILGCFLLLTFYMHRVSNLFLSVHLLTYCKNRSKGGLFFWLNTNLLSGDHILTKPSAMCTCQENYWGFFLQKQQHK